MPDTTTTSLPDSPTFHALLSKLREIFQIDRPELDFGIYRILNARAGEINDYLQNRLAAKVREALSAGSAASARQLQAELQEAEKNAQALGVSPDAVPKVQELRARLKDASAGGSEHENAVFSHLLTFFSRYYKDGDFISQRRYKGDTYAIPYAGEEVMLHWANKDQYYTKSGENFSNYSFKLEDGRSVHFRLVAADTVKDNRKDNDKERRFALVAEKTVTRTDDQGDEVEEIILPLEEVAGADGTRELIVRFEYAAQPKGTKQETLVKSAVETVLADAAVQLNWPTLANREPTEKNPQRTLLEKHLTHYTAKNTADYFIHKDLGGFLRRELDFYIKNEVMHLDDVQNAGAFADIEKKLRMIQCLRAIALELTAFLAQLEDFQKKLWLKKKFVVSSHYCMTLDRVPEELYPEIAACDAQREEWVRLFGINEIKSDFGRVGYSVPLTVGFLKENPSLILDTSHLPTDLRGSIRAATTNSIEDSLVIKSDNFAGLRSIEGTFRNRINYTFIDPPYNTGSGDFCYKDSFQHSSWLAMMVDRLRILRSLVADEWLLLAAISDIEGANLRYLYDLMFGSEFLATLAWQKTYSPRMDALTFSFDFDQLIAAGSHVGRLPFEQDKKQFSKKQEGQAYRRRTWRKEGSSSRRQDRPNLFYAIQAPDGTKVFPIRPDGTEGRWRGGMERFIALGKDDLIEWQKRDDGWQVFVRQMFDEDATRPPSTLVPHEVAGHNHEGVEVLKALMGGLTFDNPKPPRLVEFGGKIASEENSFWTLDFFGGSGTTGHAVINLNREDGGDRKYILIEMGEHFDTVLVPRLKKVIYSKDWKDGKPQSRNTGISHCFKILRLESYEDTLNNLQLRRSEAQDDLLSKLTDEAKDDYLLHYLLNVESRGSLLSVEDFRKPFDYTLNIAVDSAGAFEPRKIDLVETFNYLIGLRVKHIDAQPQRGFVTVTGTLPSGESCLVLWRDCEVLDYEGVSKLCDKLAINPADSEFDVVYLNGDHNIPTVLTQTAEEGGVTRVLKLRQIEPEFLERMFKEEEV